LTGFYSVQGWGPLDLPTSDTYFAADAATTVNANVLLEVTNVDTTATIKTVTVRATCDLRRDDRHQKQGGLCERIFRL
jgi:hypothetical protein